jgi:hypothetical protein
MDHGPDRKKKERKTGPTYLAVEGQNPAGFQRAALPPCPKQWELATNYMTLSISDMDT